ncbi:MAG: HAD family hydrolase [Erysipelotrichaceae bacterium]|nr:HAD family hydrolase [Erysipelotrichaceae bacterium]MBO4537725.1 HAD family hydrolase [Erysipelotrichaceae bacterium]MBR5048748.1 HAD family hydrolase [Erysipelotrichaceae bacterium]
MKEIRLLAIDMDGTLLKDDKSIDDADFRAVQRAANSGIEVVMASGRPLIMMPEKVLQINQRYAIISNGAKIIDLRNRQTVFHQTMDLEMTRRFLEALENMDCWICLESGDASYYGGRNINDIAILQPRIRNHRGKYVRNLFKLFENEDFPLEKVIVRTLKENEARILRLQGEFPGFNIMDNNDGALEINDRNSSKGAALKWLCQHMGIARENVAAIGDSDNDLTMLNFARYSVAMANSSDFIRQICWMTTSSNMENGVEKAIDRLMEL